MSKAHKALVVAAWLCSMVGCSAPDYVSIGECAPDALFPDPWCLDAGADADARDDPKEDGGSP